MVPEQHYGSTRQWFSGIHPMLVICWRRVQSLTYCLFAFFVTCLAEKIDFPCTNKASQKKMNAHRLPSCSTGCILLCAGWAPDTTRGAEGSCSPESTDRGPDDEVLQERQLKNALGRAERTHKLQTTP